MAYLVEEPADEHTKQTENKQKRQRIEQLLYPWWSRPLYCRVLSPIIMLFWVFFVVRRCMKLEQDISDASTAIFKRFQAIGTGQVHETKSPWYHTPRFRHLGEACRVSLSTGHFDQAFFSHTENILILWSKFSRGNYFSRNIKTGFCGHWVLVNQVYTGVSNELLRFKYHRKKVKKLKWRALALRKCEQRNSRLGVVYVGSGRATCMWLLL